MSRRLRREDGSGSIDKKEFCIILSQESWSRMESCGHGSLRTPKLLVFPSFSSALVVSQRKVRVSCTWQRDCDPSPSWPPGAHQVHGIKPRRLQLDCWADSDVAEELHYITAQTKVKVDRLGA